MKIANAEKPAAIVAPPSLPPPRSLRSWEIVLVGLIGICVALATGPLRANSEKYLISIPIKRGTLRSVTASQRICHPHSSRRYVFLSLAVLQTPSSYFLRPSLRSNFTRTSLFYRPVPTMTPSPSVRSAGYIRALRANFQGRSARRLAAARKNFSSKLHPGLHQRFSLRRVHGRKGELNVGEFADIERPHERWTSGVHE